MKTRIQNELEMKVCQHFQGCYEKVLHLNSKDRVSMGWEHAVKCPAFDIQDDYSDGTALSEAPNAQEPCYSY